MILFVEKIILDSEQNDTVAILKIKLPEINLIPLDSQRMVFEGKHFEDSQKLSNYNIQGMSTVNLLLLRSGQ